MIRSILIINCFLFIFCLNNAQLITTGNIYYNLVQDSDKPAFDLTPNQTRMASCYQDKAGIYHLFADYMEKERGSWNAVIRHYKSTDLYHWEYVSTVARHGEVGKRDARGCSSPHIYATDEKIYLFYGGTSRPVGGNQDIWAEKGKQGYFSRQFILAIAEADKNGAPKGNFAKHGVILEPGEIGDWDSMRMDGPCVVAVGDTLHLFYNAFDANKDRNRVRVGYAKASINELKFTKYPEPILSVPGGGEMPRVFKTGSEWHMFYLHHKNYYSREGGYKWQHHTSRNGINWELSDPYFFNGHSSAFPPDIMMIYGMNGQLLDRPKVLVAGSENDINKLWLYNLKKSEKK